MKNTTEDVHDDDDIELGVYLCLLGLTGLTLLASHLGEGRLMAVAIALIIASGKASLIGFYFMGLKREKPLMYAILAIGFTAVAILFIGILPDMTTYLR